MKRSTLEALRRMASGAKYGLNTEDLKGILKNLENLEANLGYVPSYFENIS